MIAPRIWRAMPQRYRYEAGKCKKCGKITFPPRLICSSCKSREFETITLDRTGTLLTYTIIRVPPSPFKDEAPYAMGIAEMEGGGRITTQIVDCDFDKLKIIKGIVCIESNQNYRRKVLNLRKTGNPCFL